MKRCLNLISKFVVVYICAVALCVSTLAYDPRKAVDYAKRHWCDGKGLCAEFVSDCLIAGGVRFSKHTDAQEGRVAFRPGSGIGYYTGCWGLYYDLEFRLDEVKIEKPLIHESDGTLRWDKNPCIRPGDVLFIFEISHGLINDSYSHVVLVGDRVGDKVTMYGHNNPRNNEVLRIDPATQRWVCAHFIK